MFKKIIIVSFAILQILTRAVFAIEFYPAIQPNTFNQLQSASDILKNKNFLSESDTFLFFKISDYFVNQPAPYGAGLRISSRETAYEMLSSPLD